jgi:gliding motility-associated-like protein
VTSTDFSLLCYTRNVSDPGVCSGGGSGKSAWFKFEVSEAAQILIALEKIGVPNGWLASAQDISVWREAVDGNPLTERLSMSLNNSGHEWLQGCVDPGTYFLLVRHCSWQIDTIQPYRIVMKLVDAPGDFCYNAIPIDVTNLSPTSGSALVNCHTIGTDIGEIPPVGNSCFGITGRKTTWFHVLVNAGPMVDLKFQLGENFTSSAVDLSDVTYRILSGTCGAMTPIACSEGNINLTLDCLGPGDYYVQVSMPQKTGTSPASPNVEGTISLTVTATASNPVTCTEPVDPNEINANFTYLSDCQAITFFNLSTAGSDIIYLWEFPDSTSSTANPVWTPPPGSATYTITLTVTNTVSGSTTSISHVVTINAPFALYIPMTDTSLCNGMGSILLNAAIPGATYLWDNNSTGAQRLVSAPGEYSVIIALDGCEKRDTVIVEGIDATLAIDPTICPESEYVVGSQVFDITNPAGTVIIPGADPSGCDSILTISLSFYADATHQLSEVICAGESFSFGQENLTQTGTYQDILVSAHGCDSVVTLHLTVTPRISLDHQASGCIGASLALAPLTLGILYEWTDGTMTDSLIVNTPGIYTVSVSDANNCIISEETFTVTFGTLSAPAVSIPDPMCIGEDVLLMASGSSGAYQWFDAASGGTLLGTGPTLILPAIQSDRTVYVQAFQVGIDTCISPRTPALVQVIADNIEFVEIDTAICEKSLITLPWGEQIEPETNSSFSYTWQNSITGCDSLTMTVNVSILNALALSLPSTLTIQFGDSILLEPVISFIPDSLIWEPSEGLSCNHCLQPWAQPLESTDYTLSVWSVEGCHITAPERIEVDREPRVYIPNVFSPNGDGINDIFTIVANREIRMVRSLILYDRWGGVMWEEHNFVADGTHGWDGSSGDALMQPGVYVWRAEIEFRDGSTEMLAGDVTLLR